MPKLNRVYLRLGNDEYAKIRLNAEAKGFTHVSEYMRSLALEKDFVIVEKILETNRIVKKILALMEHS